MISGKAGIQISTNKYKRARGGVKRTFSSFLFSTWSTYSYTSCVTFIVQKKASEMHVAPGILYLISSKRLLFANMTHDLSNVLQKYFLKEKSYCIYFTFSHLLNAFSTLVYMGFPAPEL